MAPCAGMRNDGRPCRRQAGTVLCYCYEHDPERAGARVLRRARIETALKRRAGRRRAATIEEPVAPLARGDLGQVKAELLAAISREVESFDPDGGGAIEYIDRDYLLEAIDRVFARHQPPPPP